MKIMQLPAKIEQWETVYEILEKTLELSEISEKTKYEISVSAEEIFTNIASYAYGSDVGMVEISWGWKDEAKKEFQISFKDWGTPYNPLESPDPDFNVSFEERRIGGLGIYMVKKFMDRAEYRSENGCNIFTIWKNL